MVATPCRGARIDAAHIRLAARQISTGRAYEHMAIEAAKHGRFFNDACWHAGIEEPIDLVCQACWDGTRRIVGADPRAKAARRLSLGSEGQQAQAKNRSHTQFSGNCR